MPQPPEYVRQANFTDHSTNSPTEPHSGVNLDAEFNAVKTTNDAVRANLEKIQRDDGALANNSVGVDQMRDEITLGLNRATDWGPGRDYAISDAVYESRKLYRCLIEHTSTISFADDLAAGNWAEVVDHDQFVAQSEAAQVAAAASAVAAGASETAAADAAGAAAASETVAADAAGAAATSEANAADSAAAAATSLSAAGLPDPAVPNTFLRRNAANTAYEAKVANEIRYEIGGIPPGAVMPFAMNTAPTGWLQCDGSAVSRTTYADLFTAISTTFGEGDGSTTFTLPDLRGEFIRGWADGGSVDSGRTFGSSQLDALQNLTGEIQNVKSSGTPVATGVFSVTQLGGNVGGSDGTSGIRHFDFDASRVARTSTETRPRNVALMYCIKT